MIISTKIKIFLKGKNKCLIQKILFANTCFALLAWNVCVATPYDIYIVNSSLFPGLHGMMLLKISIQYAVHFWAILNILFLCLLLLCKDFIQKLTLMLLFAIAISTWINITLLVGDYGQIDGFGYLNVDHFSFLSFLQIAIFFILLSVAFIFRKNFKRLNYISCCVLFISVSTCLWNILLFKTQRLGIDIFSLLKNAAFLILFLISLAIVFISMKKFKRQILCILCLIVSIRTFSKEASTAVTNTKENFFFYSADNPNILMILLDAYQKEFFEHILDDELKKQLEGFIWFQDTLANFPRTPHGMLTIFTGEIPNKIIQMNPQMDYAKFYTFLAQKSIAKRFKEAGGQMAFTGNLSGYPPILKLFPQNSHMRLISKSREVFFHYTNLLNYSIFRAVPDIFKLKVYNNHKGLIRHYTTKLDSYNIDSVSQIYPWMKTLVETKPLVKKDYPATFRLYYFFLTHPPIIFNENCTLINPVSNTLENQAKLGSCAIKIVIDIINNLKSVNVFDNTIILVLSDHGNIFLPENFKKYNFPYGWASSTLLIKPLGRTKAFTIRDYQAQLGDIPKTISQAINLPNDYSGVDLLSENKVKSRMRIFYQTRGDDNLHQFRDDKMSQKGTYEIHGPSNDPNNWRKIK